MIVENSIGKVGLPEDRSGLQGMKVVAFETSETIAQIDTLNDVVSLIFAINSIANDHNLDVEYRNAIQAVVREAETRTITVRDELEEALNDTREASNE